MLLIAGVSAVAIFSGGDVSSYFPLDVRSDALEAAARPPAEPIFQFHPSADETTYLCTGRNGEFLQCDMKTGGVLARYGYRLQRPVALDVTADDRLIVVTYENREVVAWERNGKRLEARRLMQTDERALCCCLTSDGRFAALGCVDGSIHVVNVASGRSVACFSADGGAVRTVCFAPDGRSLLAAADDGSLCRFDAFSGTALQRYVGHVSTVRCLQFDQSGSRFVSAGIDGTARLWKVDRKKPTWTIRIPGSSVVTAALSRDGRQVAVGGTDGGSILFGDVDARTLLQTTETRCIAQLQFSRREPGRLFYVTLGLDAGVFQIQADHLAALGE